MGTLSFGPGTLDIGEAGTNFFLLESVRKTKHVAFVARWRRPASLVNIADAIDQDLVRMVPRIPGGVVRRCRQAAVRASLAPRRLAFQIRTVAARAVLGIDAPPHRQQPSVIGVDQGRPVAALPGGPSYRADEEGDTRN